MKSLSFRENIWNLTRNVYLMSIFSITTSRYQRHILVNKGNNKTYFSMMFNIHKHISHLIFVLVPECGEYEICNQKIILRSISRQRPFFYWQFSSVIDRNRNRPFHLIQNKVGYRSCFATGVKLGTILWVLTLFK